MTAPTSLLGMVDDTQYGTIVADVYEHIPALYYPASVAVFAEMRRDSRLTAVVDGYGLQIRRAQWQLDGTGCRPEVTQFVADCLGLNVVGEDKASGFRRRGVSWNDHLRAALLCEVFGHYAFELAAEIDDRGRARLATLAERIPATITNIHADPKTGELVGIDQQIMTTRQRGPQIPADRLVFYSRNREGASWQGTSLLRPAYAPWLLKREMMRVAAISNRRWGAGVPVAEALPGTNPSPEQLAAAQRMASAARAGDQAGAAVPPGFTLKIVGLSGSIPDTVGFIRLLNQEMSGSVLMPHLDLGTSDTGARALGESFIDSWTLALESEAEAIADTATRQCVARIVEWNWGEDEPVPRVVVSGIGSRREITAESLNTLLSCGALSVDPKLEAWVRREYRLPERDPNAPKPLPAGPPARTGRAAQDGQDTPPEGDNPDPQQVAASIDGDQVEAHLPGKHNQLDHGRKGKGGRRGRGSSGDGQDTARGARTPTVQAVKVNVLPRGKAWPFGSSWQEDPDPDNRAGALWSESFAGLNAVRQTMRNLAAGKKWDDGVDTNHGRFRMTYMRIEDEQGNEGKVYSHDDMRAEILSAAMRMQAKLDAGTVHRKRLYRGLRMNRDDIWQVGDTFSQDIASWTEERDWATVYANTEDRSTGHVGDAPVVVSLVGPKRSTDIDDILAGAQQGSKEHIAGGTYRVTKVSKSGRYWNVQVEQVNV